MPATVKASVPDVVIGEPATEIKPPVKDCAMLVTVPTVVSVAQLGNPAATTSLCPLVPIGSLATVLAALA